MCDERCGYSCMHVRVCCIKRQRPAWPAGVAAPAAASGGEAATAGPAAAAGTRDAVAGDATRLRRSLMM